MAEQSSRLHRLLTLLDTGSTQATRLAAARQIGDIAKSHPLELSSLIKKVSQFLRSRNWDTRVAAAHAIGAVAANVKHTTLKEMFSYVEAETLEIGMPDVTKTTAMAWSSINPSTVAGLSFSSFDVNKVLEYGCALLASGGQEFDIVGDSSKNPVDRLSHQKKNLHRRLGLDICEQFMDVNEVIKDEDLVVPKGYPHGNALARVYYSSSSGQNIQQLVANMVPSFRPKRLSARELNLLKRKAKINAKDQSKGLLEDDEFEGLQTGNPEKGSQVAPMVANKGSVEAFVAGEESHGENECGKWPFYDLVEQLIHDIFDPIWEIRHGATMALREILSRQGGCAGVIKPDLSSDTIWLDAEDMNISNAKKRIRQIDLNSQTTVDEHAPECKRIKAETEMETDLSTFCLSKEVKVNNHSNVKVEPGLANGFHLVSKQEDPVQKPLPEEKNSSNMIFLADLPDSCELKRLIKLARNSCLKNWEFLQDCAIRFLCVLSLDRFGDFVSDQVVAPVRETCAQALGAVIKHMHPSMVHETLNVLLYMQCRQEWEVRHGCLLGVKYLVAVRKDMLDDLLVRVLPACKAGLQDPDDDVRAVAAEVLIPAASALASLEEHTLNSVVMLLWDILLDLDDLSPSTSSVMNLLAEIYSQPEMAPKILASLTSIGKQDFDLNRNSRDGAKYEENPYILSTLTPRLWPFMRHNITSVRHSAIQTLERLLEVFYESCSGPSAIGHWTATILGDTLRIVFQNLLLESDESILQCSERVWRLLIKSPKQDLEIAARSFFSSWVQLATTPVGSTLDAAKMFFPAALPRKSHFKAAAKMRAVKLENDYSGHALINFTKENNLQEKNADVARIIVGADVEKSVTRTRVDTAAALGIFASKLPEATLQVVNDALWNDLSSTSGFQRQVASMVLIAWFKELKSEDSSRRHQISGIVNPIRELLLELLTCSDPSYPTKDSSLPYAELSKTYTKMRSEASILFRVAGSSGIFKNIVLNANVNLEKLSVDDAIDFASKISLPTDKLNGDASDERQLLDDIESSKQQLLSTSGYLKRLQTNLHVTVLALVAAAIIWISELPPRLNPVILPLTAAVKREKEEILQEKAAEALAELVHNCIGRKPSPNDKLIKNLCNLTWTDPCETPQAAVITSISVIEEQDLLSYEGAPINKKTKAQVSLSSEDRSKLEGFISRRGSECALLYLCQKFGPTLFDKLPKLWECLTEILRPITSEGHSPADDKQTLLPIDDCKDPQSLINNIQVVQSIASVVDAVLRPRILTLLPCIFHCVRHFHVAVRLAASRCITSMAKSMTISVMAYVIKNAIPMLGDLTSVDSRQGAGMLLSLLVQGLGMELVPYAPLLVVPLLRCMGDSNHTVRESITRSFAALVPLLPLSRGVHTPVELCESLSRNSEDAQFLEQLLDNSHIDDYKLPINLKVDLRRYQQEGINWLSFLRRFKLHGILCDDMGLGKTLQASAIVASDISEKSICSTSNNALSLIICPSTLIGHWAYEIEKYIDSSIMVVLQYIGSAQERFCLLKKFDKYNVIITSYDIVRKDIDDLRKISWNYCILDEGHIIKNSKAKITGSVKQLKAEHRLILSGTPIQNNVLELWSLFDFLMPGFLGSERQFQATYGKPFLAAKNSKFSAKDAEAGVLAMEALHKQVMPFILRRTKDEVLSDLPEKIIQDRYCDLSPVQLKLYEQFSSSDAKREISDFVGTDQEPTRTGGAIPAKATSHIFQALQYLLKLCSHPLLVLGQKPPATILSHLVDVLPGSCDAAGDLHDLCHSPKLVALQEILEECGVGLDASNSENTASVGQHRVLIFSQHRAFLDIIERDLFQAHMKSVTYLRLDGSVEPEKRFDVVKSFNSDPTIDVLLLTTHVGGLGLNLTSADTLVFMEHDWNPMKDLQAMDRAHRLGQRKVVNVHRIIMRGTLEEKVMNLQKFKMSVANAVINAENASLKTMNTEQLLDLFTPAQTTGKSMPLSRRSDGSLADERKSVPGGKGLKAMLDGLEELWDQSQYTEEYDLNHFLAKLTG